MFMHDVTQRVQAHLSLQLMLKHRVFYVTEQCSLWKQKIEWMLASIDEELFSLTWNSLVVSSIDQR